MHPVPKFVWQVVVRCLLFDSQIRYAKFSELSPIYTLPENQCAAQRLRELRKSYFYYKNLGSQYWNQFSYRKVAKICLYIIRIIIVALNVKNIS